MNDSSVEGSRTALEYVLEILGTDHPNTSMILNQILSQNVQPDISIPPHSLTDEIDMIVFG